MSYQIKSPAVYKICPKCKIRQCVQDEVKVYYCDECGKEIPEGSMLEVNNWTRKYLKSSHHPKEYNYCSWRCVFQGISKMKSQYFISLPYITADPEETGRRGGDLKEFKEALLIGKVTNKISHPNQKATGIKLRCEHCGRVIKDDEKYFTTIDGVYIHNKCYWKSEKASRKKSK